MTSFDGRFQNLQMSPTHFCASAFHFRDIKIKKKLPSKSRSRSRNTILSIKPSAICAITPFDGKFQNLQMSILHF